LHRRSVREGPADLVPGGAGEEDAQEPLHLDITVSGGRANPIETRRRLVDAEARRLEALGATLVRALFEDGLDHYGIAMRDPEGNEFDINLRSLARRSRRAVRTRYPPI
jgi:hypothetical protein